MCYSALVKKDIQYLENTFGAMAVRIQFDRYAELSKLDPKRFPKVAERIFPLSYAPVIFEEDGKRKIELMRYSAYVPVAMQNPNKYTTFNARRDNLTSPFWSGCFMKHHGVIVLRGFYEWVAVKDLLSAGVVKLDEVKAEFERQAEARKQKVESAGKAYKRTKTENMDARLRRVIIEFQPKDKSDLVVPVIFSRVELEDGTKDAGFAIVTDEPTPEIEAAGHDRCPVIINPEEISKWLNVKSQEPKYYDQVLSNAVRKFFHHSLPKAA